MTAEHIAYERSDGPSRIIAALEAHRSALPFADEALAELLPLRQQLGLRQELGELAIARWQTAVALRWRAEVVAQRLYAQVRRQLSSLLGSAGTPEPDMLLGKPHPMGPSELLDELRRLHGALCLCQTQPATAPAILDQLAIACDELAQAIATATQHECERRRANLEYRIIAAAFERAELAIERRIIEYTNGAEGDLGATEIGR